MNTTQQQLQRLIVNSLAHAVEKNGLAAINEAQKRIEAMIEGKSVPLDFTDLRLASEMLTVMERMEDRDRDFARDVLAHVLTTMGPVVASVLRLMVP